MSDPHRAASGSLSGGAGDRIPPADSRRSNLIRKRRSIFGGAAAALALTVSIAGGSVFAQTPPSVTVQPGETLTGIALRYYGDAAEADVIATANRLMNPDLVFAGMQLRLPSRDGLVASGAAPSTAATPSSIPVAASARRVTVALGETLTSIALREYGAADYADALAAANGITQPNLIRAGQELALPSSLRAASGRGTLAGRSICIDPGHGGAESGAAYVFDDGRTLREADVTLDISLALAQRLRAQGADVTLTRQSDLTLELANRAYLCNISGADIAISVHLNGVDNRAINGALALHGKASDIPLAEAMAGVMQSGLFSTARTDAIDFGARHFGARVLLYTTMPAVLVEPAFLTNPAEARSLLAPTADPTSRRAQIVRELERGVATYLR
ncbi:MAG: N-acetylmuramoyl-L-alanine amidase [Dehalococcoidia bacterium]